MAEAGPLPALDLERWKQIPVAKLQEALAKLPPDWKVECNAVGNLLVVDDMGKSVGFIDFLDVNAGNLEMFEETER